MHILTGPARRHALLRRARPHPPAPGGMVRPGLLPVAGQWAGCVCCLCEGPSAAVTRGLRATSALKSLSPASAGRNGHRQDRTFCGFPELGRFSVRYHQLYGQPPSQTLRQQLQPVVAPFNRTAVAPPLNRKTTP